MSGRRTKALRRAFIGSRRLYVRDEGSVFGDEFRQLKRGNVFLSIDRYAIQSSREARIASNNARITANPGWHAKATYGKDKRAGSFAHHQVKPKPELVSAGK